MALSRALRGGARQKICGWSSGEAELLEDACHCNCYGLVVGVDGSWVARPAGRPQWLSGGEEVFDGFVSGASGRSPTKNLWMVKRRGRAPGRRLSLQLLWLGSGRRWVLGCAPRGSAAVAERRRGGV